MLSPLHLLLYWLNTCLTSVKQLFKMLLRENYISLYIVEKKMLSILFFCHNEVWCFPEIIFCAWCLWYVSMHNLQIGDNVKENQKIKCLNKLLCQHNSFNAVSELSCREIIRWYSLICVCFSTVVSTVTSQQESSWFKPQLDGWMFLFSFIHVFPLICHRSVCWSTVELNCIHWVISGKRRPDCSIKYCTIT